MTLTSPELLTNLPAIVFIWTCLSLSWGGSVTWLYNTMISYYASRGIYRRYATDLCNMRFMILASVVLFSYLLISPYVQNYAGESFIIINIFYNAYLITSSARVYLWWREKTLKEFNRAKRFTTW